MAQTHWNSLGTPVSRTDLLSVGRNADGRLEAFATNDNSSENGLWHAWQVRPGGSWG